MNWPKGISLLAAMMAAAATDKNLFAAPYYTSIDLIYKIFHK